MRLSAATEAVPAAVAADRRRARRSRWRRRLTVLAFLSPWLVGFSVFFGYPLVMSAWLSLHSYDLLTPARWVGLANYRYMFGDDPQIWPAIYNTLWLVVFAVPLTVLFAFGIAMLLTRARVGDGVFRTVFYLPALVPPVAATLGFVYLLNPSTGPVNVILGWVGIEGPLWFNDPGWSKPSLVMLGLWGVGTTMIIFLAAILDVPRASLRVGRARRGQRAAAAALGDAADDQPGDPLRGRARRDRLAPVLHAGARRGQRRRRVGVAGGLDRRTSRSATPQGSTLFYPILVYNHGFRDFNMGYASAMAMLLLVVAFAVTAILIWSSRRVVHYQGNAR